MDKIQFSWDENKNDSNINKHGISFEEAKTVFYDENARVIYDPDHSIDEDRFMIIGLSKRFMLLVVSHCYRDNDEHIRIISARRATKNEQKQYMEYIL